MTPKKISHPRPGMSGSLMAETVVATPRKMKPTAIQMASSSHGCWLVASPRCRKARMRENQ